MIRHAILLTAGLGTRLRPLTDVRAKPAIPVAGEPMIRRIIRSLAVHGVTDLVLNLHHRPETITAVVGDGADLGVRVRYSWEQPRVLGSAGGPRRAAPILGADPFLIVNGDTMSTVDIGRIVEAHTASDALVTLALVPNREYERYGGVRLDDRGAVSGFVRRGPASAGSYHFVGIQVAASAAFGSLTDGEPVNSIGGVYDRLISSNPGSIRGVVCDADFWDVGTPADYWRTSKALGHVGSILWDDVEVGANASIEDCIVTDHVRIPAGAAYRRAILRWHDGQIIASPLDVGADLRVGPGRTHRSAPTDG